jgi:type I restriction enzyme S subunit
MIEGLQPYSEYKETCLPWLERCPKHWVIKRGKSYLTCIDRRSETGKEELLTVSSARGVVPRNSANVTMFKAASYVGHKLCWPGDLVINSLWAWAGGVGVSAYHGIISTAYSVYRSRPSSGIIPKYLHELVRSYAFKWELHVRSKGIWISRLQLTDTAFLDAPIPLPPTEEQEAIARFLDHADGRIDRAIRAKRKVIALLNEQKQAIIHKAVTRGLNPDAPLKPSGIPWLGDIPAHWEVRRAKYLFREVDERSKEGKETHLAMSQRLGLVPSSQVESAMRSESYAGAKLCQEGDLVLNRLKAHLGVFALAKQVGVISPDYTVFRKCASISMEYYESVLRSSACRRELRVRAKGLVEGFWRLYTDDFYDIRLPIPPLDEQREIMSAIGIETESLSTAIARKEREIELLREYRTRLTADVVTGKLDVRDAAKPLPSESPVTNTEDTFSASDLEGDEEPDLEEVEG